MQTSFQQSDQNLSIKEATHEIINFTTIKLRTLLHSIRHILPTISQLNSSTVSNQKEITMPVFLKRIRNTHCRSMPGGQGIRPTRKFSA